jgi:Zn-dependent peptidase ImmA (M78 family)
MEEGTWGMTFLDMEEEFGRREIILIVKLMKSCSGCLQVMEWNWVCFINATEARTRRLFTMAHELYHYDHHRGLASCFKDFFGQADTRMEREADRGAARMLMPREKLVEAMALLSTRNEQLSLPRLVEILAQSFSVSREAMAYRLCEPEIALIQRYQALELAKGYRRVR